MTIPSPSGCFDILPVDTKDIWKSAYLWNYLEKIMREHAALYGFEEIRTPMFERTELFLRSVGDETDIVSKEMYTFLDRGGRSLSLRPEGTASVIRAFVEKNLAQTQAQHRFFYIGPMFRYERPQAGRFRQHNQFGVEVIGIAQPELDAEIIEMLYSLYERLGLKNLTVYINSLGDKETRERFRTALVDYLRPYLEKLSPESKKRFEINPLRIFDSKAEADREALKNAPSILDYLSQECKDHFKAVTNVLSHLKIPFEINSRLVRGLDYYTKTVFEITSGELGAQNTVGAGGRYDGLIKNLGGADLPSIGFATGIERIIQTLLKSEVALPQRLAPDVYIIPLGEEALYQTFSLVKELRQNGIVCLQGMSGKKLKNEMQMASDSRAKFAIVLGENELKMGVCELKEMSSGKTTKLPLNQVSAFFKKTPVNSDLT
jgi:histidyl-tRNA synthetase